MVMANIHGDSSCSEAKCWKITLYIDLRHKNGFLGERHKCGNWVHHLENMCISQKKKKISIYIYIVVQLYLLQSLNQASNIKFFVGIDILRP